MNRVTSTKFQQAVGSYSDAALNEPVIITSHNRDRLVLFNVKEYERLKRRRAEHMGCEIRNFSNPLLPVHLNLQAYGENDYFDKGRHHKKESVNPSTRLVAHTASFICSYL